MASQSAEADEADAPDDANDDANVADGAEVEVVAGGRSRSITFRL